jgi:glutathione S-transferase
MTLPILYSYRRCPYAMRARMALSLANIQVEIREISLRDKPKHMLSVSPKGTVPVLVLPHQQVLEQSLDIMHWALQQCEDQHWLSSSQAGISMLIRQNDTEFKQALDGYKYPERYPDFPPPYFRQQGEVFLQILEIRLNASTFLMNDKPSLADIAIFPFIRQFVAVDSAWFADSPYPKLRAWLDFWLNSALFEGVMQKYPTYQESET